MSSRSTLIRNVFASSFGFVLQVAITLGLTPFVLHELGEARYGAWSLLMGFTGYYGLLDLGFRAGLTQYITRYLAVRDFARASQTASTGFFCLSLLGGFVVLLSAVMAWLGPLIFQFPDGSDSEVRWSILIVGGGVALQFPFFAYSAILTAAQRFDVSNAIGTVTRLLSAAAAIVALKADWGLVGLAVATTLGNLLDYGLRYWMARQIVPGILIRREHSQVSSFWEFMTFGVWNVLIGSSQQVIAYVGMLIIGVFLPAIAVTPYVLATNVIIYFTRFIMPMTAVFFPAATELDAVGDTAGLVRMYLGASRMILGLAIAAGTIGIIWCDAFFQLWIGAEQANAYGSASGLFPPLMLAAILTAGQRIGYQVLLGMRQSRLLALLLAGEGIANLILSALLINLWGLTGVAIATLLPAFVFHGVLHPLVVSRQLRTPLRTCLISLYGRPLLLAMALIPVLYAVRRVLPAPDQWAFLSVHGLAGGLLSAILLSACILTRSERRRYLWEPVQSRLGCLRPSDDEPGERPAPLPVLPARDTTP